MKDLRKLVSGLQEENAELTNQVAELKDKITVLSKSTDQAQSAIFAKLPSCPAGHKMKSQIGASPGISSHKCDKCGERMADTNGCNPFE